MSDTEAKEIRIETDSVEVIVSDSMMRYWGSQFGHVAIIVDGVAYSRAHGGYDAKKTHAEYISAQEGLRNSGDTWVACPRRKRRKLKWN